MNQIARIKEIVDWRNENIQKETYATHLAFDSIEQVINSEETEINNVLLNNITAKEKFTIICRAKNIDIQEIGQEIYQIIENSDYYDKSEYLEICDYEDEYGDIQDRYCLNIHIDMLTTKDDWIKAHMDAYNISYEECEQTEWELYVFGDEFNDNQKNFIKLAFDCGVESISLWW